MKHASITISYNAAEVKRAINKVRVLRDLNIVMYRHLYGPRRFLMPDWWRLKLNLRPTKDSAA